MNTQTCESCEHFNRHYVKHITRFTPVDCGYCKLNAKHIKKPSGFVCAHFALLDIGLTKNARNQSIQHMLARIAKNLEDVLAVLNSDTMT